ncbi:19527_t:CDS:2 [Funneliformis geosporum]|uniref:12204_t:CDS:1 n=1 Tax=Funneliformis geosporum TaxID=1117311 RepID=A0A9W4SBV4_9GLOM|nr:12204_t:CDS:2 [Funneliformis geosporum]CAI2163650.1 19527_t:CDS:2 [Funneliformis geosporum]
MKSSIIIAIIFGLVTSITLTLIEGYTVWIQNKALRGTTTLAAATLTYEKDAWNWTDAPDINSESGIAHQGYSLDIPNEIKSYYLVFWVFLSLRQDKWRGPFNNDGDKCWHFHGTQDFWDVYPCPY